jgi:hypothetical protein
LLDDGLVAIRQLWHRPLFTLTAVLTRAIGIRVNAVAFTVVNRLLLRGSAVSVGSTVGRIVTTPGGDEEGTRRSTSSAASRKRRVLDPLTALRSD